MSGYTKDVRRVCRQALKLGGTRVADGADCLFDIEKDAKRTDWRLWAGSKTGRNTGNFRVCKSAKGYKMESSKCHRNSAVIADMKGWDMYTGLALSRDGIWRVHSWVIAKTGRLYETTIPRVLYFGCKQDAKEVADVLAW